jgi:hypothetical protein
MLGEQPPNAKSSCVAFVVVSACRKASKAEGDKIGKATSSRGGSISKWDKVLAESNTQCLL